METRINHVKRPMEKEILLSHGSGGRSMHQLVEGLIVPQLNNPTLSRLEDQALLDVGGVRLAFTTDSFVVDPIFFPGGDIGSLSVHGTINDLAMGGARPVALSLSLILEEGLPMADLERVLASVHRAAEEVGVSIVTGDTKVVHRHSADKLFINTSGVGVVEEGVVLDATTVQDGDAIIVSGTLGDHGMAIMSRREGFVFDAPIESDSAPLWSLVEAMLAAAPGAIRTMRDPTRGGLATTLNELAQRAGVGMVLLEEEIPVHEPVQAACEILGLDPLYVANEGKLVAMVEPSRAGHLLEAMQAHPHGTQARIIGHAVSNHPGEVVLRTTLGGTRIVDMLSGDPLPRIC